VFDGPALEEEVVASRAEVVIYQVTDLALAPGETLSDERLERNALVREAGTQHIVAATAAVGARRLIAQSVAWLYLPGPEPHTEDEAIIPPPPATTPRTRQAVLDLERFVTTDRRFEGVVLRYGRLYGPGTWTATPDEPPTVHVEAAARAAALAVDRGEPGIYHVANDGGPVSTEKARRLLGWKPV
jgi:nucleoside-diphosphate-sugar epimerase